MAEFKHTCGNCGIRINEHSNVCRTCNENTLWVVPPAEYMEREYGWGEHPCSNCGELTDIGFLQKCRFCNAEVCSVCYVISHSTKDKHVDLNECDDN